MLATLFLLLLVAATASNAQGFAIERDSVELSKRDLRATEVFKFDINCAGISNADCALAKPILERAGARIASVINFKQKVEVKVVFEAGINQGMGCPSFLAASRNGGEVLLYPKALMKQSQYVEDGRPDIYMHLNSNSSRWRANNSPVTSDSYDLEVVAARILTHGLGFKTGLRLYKNPNAGTDFMGPLLRVNDDTLTYFLGFHSLSVFDSLLSGGRDHKTMTQLAATFTNASTIFVNINSKEEMDTAQTELFEKVKNATDCVQLARSPDLAIRLPNNQSIGLISDQPNVPQVEFQIRSDGIENNKDFLMTKSSYSSWALSSMLSRSGSDYIYGPKTLQVMELLGYETETSKAKYSHSNYSILKWQGFFATPAKKFWYGPANAEGNHPTKNRPSSYKTAENPKRFKS